MKRISISAIVLLVVAAGAAQARHVYGYGYWHGYSANRNRVRWSIYKHGLISGDVYYSPYAHRQGSSGLVDGDVRYSPYAFGHGKSGLVIDGGGSFCSGVNAVRYSVLAHSVAPGCSAHPRSSHSHRYANQAESRKQTVEARRARRIELAQARREKNAIRANDGKEIIAGYLRDKNIDFRTTRILSIEGKIVSVDFLLNDGSTILKYWNPEEILSLGRQGRRKKFYDKYVESWSDSCAEHLRAGGKIHQIISSDADEILAKLPLCPDLNGTEKVYALAAEPHP
ncbi:MAG: hypothetical protein U9Q07_10895 [Planctomycetota bacterium]|nr:hypothetical protein [Planctomycetota bacterium]